MIPKGWDIFSTVIFLQELPTNFPPTSLVLTYAFKFAIIFFTNLYVKPPAIPHASNTVSNFVAALGQRQGPAPL